MNDTANSGRLLRPSNIHEPVSASVPKPDPLLGQVIDGRYLVESKLGEGGMGVVYGGRHRLIGKRVALKVLRQEMASDPELLQRFFREAQSASAIGNQHIVDISDFGQLPDRSTYFVMELLDGLSLSQTIERTRGPMPVARLCHVGAQIARGLAAAHTAGVVHRDLKPDNVMLVQRGADRDFVKILDFGIAKIGKSQMTRAGSVFGTPHYMSPEQSMGRPVDHRSDIYSLGIILYEMASGLCPFESKNMMQLIMQHVQQAPVPLRVAVPRADIPPGLDAIVLRCLAKLPNDRYASMDALAADLEMLAASLPRYVDPQLASSVSGAFPAMRDKMGSSGLLPSVITALPHPRPPRWPLYVMLGVVGTLLLAVIGIVLAVKLGHGKAAHGTAPSSSPGVTLPFAQR